MYRGKHQHGPQIGQKATTSKLKIGKKTNIKENHYFLLGQYKYNYCSLVQLFSTLPSLCVYDCNKFKKKNTYSFQLVLIDVKRITIFLIAFKYSISSHLRDLKFWKLNTQHIFQQEHYMELNSTAKTQSQFYPMDLKP